LRLTPGVSFWRQARRAKLPGQLAGLVVAHTFHYLLWLLSWWVIGQAALQGRFDRGWLIAWALLLFCLVPLRWLVTWTQGLLAIGAGGILKQRLLMGALRLEPEEIRHQGAGQLLGRVMESEAVESLALSGGFLALVAGIELVIAAFVLAAGAGGWFQSLVLVVWVALTLGLGWSYYRRRGRWTEDRLTMTNDLVERMVGHRTRLAQEARERWHQGEDEALDRYFGFSASMDQRGALLLALPPRGWLALALLALAPGFAFAGDNPALLAVALGGMLLAYRALQKLTTGLSHLVGAAIAWQQIRLLFRAAARSEPVPSAEMFPDRADAAPSEQPANGKTVLEAQDLLFRYPGRAEPVLRGCGLRIRRGERLLLEGPSGGGKSTLGALLSGLRRPESGLLLLRGLDRQTLGGEAWRRRVVAAPQFHENHVLTGTFAFNLLMGRQWPPRLEDFQEAEHLCQELGLEEVLKRMPAGLLQTVGETGWQLSHGEKSRLYIARALLQHAELVVLDESFASLDPENLRRALNCVLARAPTLLVIAHP
jgi:ATP-binding cassette subfamily B protein